MVMKRNYLKAGGIFCVPVLHYSLECAEAVRQVMEEIQPDVIAVELPRSFEIVYREAVARLPFLSVILFENDKGEPLYLPVEPADPIVEAVRIGMERAIPLAFVDIDVGKYPAYREEFPDTYAVHRLGLAAYYRAYEKAVPQPLYSKADRIRERGMAHHLRELKKQRQRVLFVCGMAHLGRVLKDMKTPQAMPLARAKRSKIQLFNLHPDSSREVMSVFPFLSALYEELHRPSLKPVIEKVTVPPVEKEKGALRLIDTGRSRMREEHRLMESVVKAAPSATSHDASIDRQRANLRLFDAVVREYELNTGEKTHRWQRHIFFRFARNYALAEDRLVPELFHLLTAARGSVDDNFLYDLWNQATFWPWQDESHRYPTIKISGEDIWLGTRKIRVRRYFPSKKARPVPLKRRKREGRPGEWSKEMQDGDSICSYQPEDLVIENYGRFLKHKGTKVLEEERCRVEPFTTSMLDGIDVRETLRNWHEKAIYVKSIRPVKGGVGSVVVIFDYDEDNDGKGRYPWRMTWLGEHEQESDMAFYATDALSNVVGPGISRTEYGGFLLSYPPLRLFDIWHDPYYRFIQSKAERLLIAALDYSQERHVVYVAPKPPRSQVVSYAARIGRKIIYIPLKQLSPVMVKKIRVLHVLSSKKVRDVAKEYIW